MIAASSPLAAQEEDGRPWSLKTEAGASLFFGASSQTAVLFRTEYGYESDRWEVTLNGGFDYAETERDDGIAFVSGRAWTSALELDYDAGRWQPFAFVNGDGSLQRQLDLRLQTGLGVGYDFLETETATFDLSTAALIERIDPRVPAGEPDEVQTLGRLSVRARGSKKLSGERIDLAFTSFYRPAFDAFGDDYIVSFEGTAAFKLTDDVSLGFSLINIFDSLAESRGARSNNDGRLLFSIITTLD
jgi:hypothetical protein